MSVTVLVLDVIHVRIFGSFSYMFLKSLDDHDHNDNCIPGTKVAIVDSDMNTGEGRLACFLHSSVISKRFLRF